MSNEDYATVKLPKKLADEVDDLIEKSHLGYLSRMEFTRDAVRRRLDQLKEQTEFGKRKHKQK